MNVFDKVILKFKELYAAGVPIIYLETEQLDLIYQVMRVEIVEWFSGGQGLRGKYDSAGQAPNILECGLDGNELKVMFNNKTTLVEGGQVNMKTIFKRYSDEKIQAQGKDIPSLVLVRNADELLGTDERKEVTPLGAALVEFISQREKIADLQNGIHKSLVVLTSPMLNIPKYLEPYIHIVEVDYPDSDEIHGIISDFYIDEQLPEDYLNRLTEAFKGFTRSDIVKTLNIAQLKGRDIFTGGKHDKVLNVIFDQKSQVIKKTGILTMIKDSDVEVGGLERLIEWETRKSEIMWNLTEAIEQWVIDIPKGVLVSGLPGTGKSLMALKTAEILKVPLISMDMGSLMGKYVGESEKNMRRAIKIVEAVSPCVLWIDELEKSFAGVGASSDDGETIKRCFAYFLTWMQNKDKPVFVFATANDISKLPPEFLRRGRFDEKFYTYMPTRDECVKIFMAHFNKRTKRRSKVKSRADILDSGILDEKFIYGILDEFAENGKFVIGADIEGIVSDAIEALFLQRRENNRDGEIKITAEQMRSKLIESAENTKTFGETNLKQIASYWLNTMENRFKYASKKELISFSYYEEKLPKEDENDQNTEKPDSRPKSKHCYVEYERVIEEKAVDNKYDRELIKAIVKKINHICAERDRFN